MKIMVVLAGILASSMVSAQQPNAVNARIVATAFRASLFSLCGIGVLE